MLTVRDILQQVETLSFDDQEELFHQLSLRRDEATVIHVQPKTGAEIVAMLEQSPPTELLYPEIKDPVEWVKQIRKDEASRRNLDWGN